MLRVELKYKKSVGPGKHVCENGGNTFEERMESVCETITEDSPPEKHKEVYDAVLRGLPGIGSITGLKASKGYVRIDTVHIYHESLTDKRGSEFHDYMCQNIILISNFLHGEIFNKKFLNRKIPEIKTMADVYKYIVK